MKKLRFAVIGTGFWANYQIPAWMELDGIELVALYNRTRSKAEALAQQYNIPGVYDDIEELLKNEQLDFADIITDVDTHNVFTEMAAKKGIAVICQKPMAAGLKKAEQMVNTCKNHQVPFFIHENWRWQAPIRKLKDLLNMGVIGSIFKARVTFCSAFPVFDNQPFLAEIDEFILTDIGSHILDVCRFLFGEARSLYCQTASVNPKIKGEDAANVMMKMENGISCYAEMSYASILEHESFPQTYILIEGTKGSIQLMNNYQVHITTRSGTDKIKAAPRLYRWLDPAYALVHSSIVDCNRDILNDLLKNEVSENRGSNNLETVRLVHAAYASARNNELITIKSFHAD
ncbi:Gfo/Idh/MocA family oxidoreductase [Mucilaginibacter sabulilitoris]|uniref:Gfo/Idh/MocA family oxidoreductase n=1 Tax=Mucilaginibacter sabulilitoris TaxID=1173583 RepID=A0ABZ0TKB0_9SPHI|nr:Gfo/Idh/MocA family oxidoreductase [Mucilaginibacter sabulilitoris]WPU93600.1 Gfo/Idh/MocA family oxidoreductase [Mucilaginibacter sabulilitoris]